MKCPECGKPVRLFTVDDEPVTVDLYAQMGTIDRLSVITNEATETDPHPGGWVRHVCQETR